MTSIPDLYENTELTIKDIASTLELPFGQVYKYIRSNYSSATQGERKRRCYRNSKLGNKNPYYGKYGTAHSKYLGEISDGKGYLLVTKPEWFTGRSGSHHVFVHQVVVCQHLGLTEMPAGHCVHHIDENPLNNALDNLLLMTTSEHRKLHASRR